MGQQRKQVCAPNTATVEPQKVEHETCSQALVHGDSGTTIPGNTCRVKVLANKPCVRLVARPHDADSVQWRAIVNGGNDATHCLARFLIRIGGVDDFQRDSVRGAVLARQQHDLTVMRECVEQGLLRGAQPLRKEDHRPARGLRNCTARSLQQICFVVPLPGQCAVNFTTETGDLTTANRTTLSHPVTQRPRHVAQVAIGVAQRGDGGLVMGNGFEDARRRSQHLANRNIDHRCRHRPSAAFCKLLAAEQLGEPEGGDELCGGDAPVGGQPAACGHTDSVGMHHHRDGGQRVATLHPVDCFAQGAERCGAVGGGQSV